MTPNIIFDVFRTPRIFHSPDIAEWMEAVAEDARPDPGRQPQAPIPRLAGSPDRRAEAAVG